MLSSKKYLKKINKHIKELDEEKIKIQRDIEKTKFNIKNNKKQKDEALEKINNLEFTLKGLKKILIDRGLIFEIENIKGMTQWDNLKIYKRNKNFVIANKDNEIVKELDKDISDIIEDIKSENINISTLVLRRTSKNALIQIRFTPYDEF